MLAKGVCLFKCPSWRWWHMRMHWSKSIQLVYGGSVWLQRCLEELVRIYGQLLSILRVKKVLQSIFWWPFWPRIRIYSRSAPEESCSRVALETFRGQCQDAPNDDKWKQWPAARNKKISRCACIGTSNSRLRTYIHVRWDHGGYSLYCLFHYKMGSPCLCKIIVPAHIL